MTRWLRFPDALPSLKGWPATLYLAAWMLLLALALWTTAGSAWFGIIDGAGDAYSWHSLGIDVGNTEHAVINRTAGDEARRAGIRNGDRIIAVDGLAMPQGLTTEVQDWPIMAHLLRASGPVRLTIRTGKARPRTVTLTRSAAHGDALYAGSGLTPVSLSWLGTLANLGAPVFLMIGSCVLFARRRDAVAALLSLSLLALTGLPPYAHFYMAHFDAEWVTSLMVDLGGIGLALTILLFPNGRIIPRWTGWVILALPVLLAVGLLVPSTLIWVFAGVVCVALAAMIVRYRCETAEGRRQWRWALIGLVAGMAIFLGPCQAYFNFLDAHAATASFDLVLWTWILTPLSITVPFTTIVAGIVLSVMRYRLYDTQAAVSRSILYGGLTLALLAIFAGTEKIIEIFGEEYFGESIGALAGGLGAAFAAVAIAPLHHRIGHWVEHRFRKNLIHLRHGLPPLLTELSETSDPAKVADAVLNHLAHGLHATRGALIRDGHVLAAYDVDHNAIAAPAADEMRRAGKLWMDKSDPVLPVRVALSANGSSMLLIGPRPDYSLYDRQERELLSELAIPIAQALRVASERTARENAVSARFELIERELCALRADLRPSVAAS